MLSFYIFLLSTMYLALYFYQYIYIVTLLLLFFLAFLYRMLSQDTSYVIVYFFIPLVECLLYSVCCAYVTFFLMRVLLRFISKVFLKEDCYNGEGRIHVGLSSKKRRVGNNRKKS